MGIGSALSRYINRGLANRFVWIELLLGVIGGFFFPPLVLVLFFPPCFEFIFFVLVLFVGGLVARQSPSLSRLCCPRSHVCRLVARHPPLRYQHLVPTRFKADLRLLLNSHLQFSPRDEYRYHEALVHPGLAAVSAPRRVLILGGGDGLAVREILKYPQIESITLVDLDPEMTRIFSSNPMLTRLNDKSLLSPRVHVINADAFPWVDSNTDSFDFIVIDFPDPTNYSLGKLYTTAFYRAVSRHLSAQGFMVVQSTSPMFARDSFWCIAQTLKQAGLQTYPYHVYVPSSPQSGSVPPGTHPYTPHPPPPPPLRP